MRGSRGHEAARLAGTTRSRPAGQDATAAATVMAVNVKRGVAEDYTASSRVARRRRTRGDGDERGVWREI